jgi:hypothetical protein
MIFIITYIKLIQFPDSKLIPIHQNLLFHNIILD